MALLPDRGPNARCGVKVLLLERAIAQGLPVTAARHVDVRGEVVGDVDGPGATAKLTLAHVPTPKDTEAHGGGAVRHTIWGQMVDVR